MTVFACFPRSQGIKEQEEFLLHCYRNSNSELLWVRLLLEAFGILLEYNTTGNVTYYTFCKVQSSDFYASEGCSATAKHRQCGPIGGVRVTRPLMKCNDRFPWFHIGWYSGLGISTSASRTMACTLCAPVLRTKPTSCSGARNRQEQIPFSVSLLQQY